MTTVGYRPVPCALCLGDESVVLYPATVTEHDFRATTFSARRHPDRIHYRIVRCRGCGLVRSDPVADPDLVASLYRESRFGYADEIAHLTRTYGRQVARVARRRHEPSAFLEIGCGNGFMLAEARRQGYARVVGVEPSADAVAHAEAGVRSSILCDVLRPGLLESATFDTTCLFQVLDHVPDPETTLDLCREALKPGGSLVIVTHNVGALSARLLGRRSPIIDVEHTFLFDPRTLATLCRARGFEVESARHIWNWCSTAHLARLLPLPDPGKADLLELLQRWHLDRRAWLLPLGNLCLVARKPDAGRIR